MEIVMKPNVEMEIEEAKINKNTITLQVNFPKADKYLEEFDKAKKEINKLASELRSIADNLNDKCFFGTDKKVNILLDIDVIDNNQQKHAAYTQKWEKTNWEYQYLFELGILEAWVKKEDNTYYKEANTYRYEIGLTVCEDAISHTSTILKRGESFNTEQEALDSLFRDHPDPTSLL